MGAVNGPSLIVQGWQSYLAVFSPWSWLRTIAQWRRRRHVEACILAALPATECICLPFEELQRRLNDGKAGPVSELEFLAALGSLQQQGRVDAFSTQTCGLVAGLTVTEARRRRRRAPAEGARR